MVFQLILFLNKCDIKQMVIQKSPDISIAWSSMHNKAALTIIDHFEHLDGSFWS